jgi:hypothetical protein
MNTSRLAILAVLAVGIAIVAATQTCRERPSADTTAPRDAKEAPAAGVAARSADTPIDLRERDRLREDAAVEPAGVPPTPEPIAPEPPPPPREDSPADAEPVVALGPPASPTIEAAMAAAKTAARAEVAKVRSEMRSKCWNGLDRGGKGEGGVQLGFSLGFDAEGHVISSAVQQHSRDDYIPGLDTCLAPFAHAIEVPAPGEPVSIEVELELP